MSSGAFGAREGRWHPRPPLLLELARSSRAAPSRSRRAASWRRRRKSYAFPKCGVYGISPALFARARLSAYLHRWVWPRLIGWRFWDNIKILCALCPCFLLLLPVRPGELSWHHRVRRASCLLRAIAPYPTIWSCGSVIGFDATLEYLGR